MAEIKVVNLSMFSGKGFWIRKFDEQDKVEFQELMSYNSENISSD